MKIIRKVTKEELEDFVYDIDLKDENLYKEVNSNNIIGIFQFVGNTAIKILRQVNPQNFEELCAINALSRPGPLEVSLPIYLNGKAGKLPDYPEKILDILKKTHGALLYQEQTMKIFSEIGGFTSDEAEEVRNLMKKLGKAEKAEKDVKAWEEVVDRFSRGCQENGILENDAKKIAEDVAAFSGYSFNLSHCASYTQIAIVTLYFSYYFRKYFYCSLLSYEEKDDELLAKLLAIKNHNINIIPPDINKSNMNFSIYNNDIIYGLTSIKGVGERAASVIISEKPYKDFYDFYIRTKSRTVTKAVVAKLIMMGVFDSIEPKLDRKKLLKIFTEFKENLKPNREPDIFYNTAYENYRYSQPVTEDELVTFENECLGYNFFNSKFFIKKVREPIQKDKDKIRMSIDEINTRPRRVPLLINNVKKILDKNNNEMLFLDCTDIKMDNISVPLFSSIYRYITVDITEGEIYYLLLHKKDSGIMFYTSKQIEGIKHNILIQRLS